MKRLGNLKSKITNLKNIRKSVLKTASGRKDQPFVKQALDNLDKFCESVKQSFLGKDFDVGRIIERDIFEGTSKKSRHIAYLASFKKQVMMSVIFDLVGEKLSKKSYPYSYGSLPNRGGLPIGYLTSPLFVHFMLSDIDFAVFQKVTHYARYMDDFILFSGNKRKLEAILNMEKDEKEFIRNELFNMYSNVNFNLVENF